MTNLLLPTLQAYQTTAVCGSKQLKVLVTDCAWEVQGLQEEHSQKGVEEEGEQSQRSRPDMGNAKVVDASKGEGDQPSQGEGKTPSEEQQTSPSHEDEAAKSQLRGPSGRTDDSHTDHDEGIQRNAAADDPSSESAQKFSKTSSDEKDMGATA